MAESSSLTDTLVVVLLYSFMDCGASIVVDLVLSEVEVRGGGMVIVLFASLTKTRSIGYQE